MVPRVIDEEKGNYTYQCIHLLNWLLPIESSLTPTAGDVLKNDWITNK